ncbi:MAG: DUF3108 domain-containing protein [Candidatus Eisenbacteria bacterium]
MLVVLLLVPAASARSDEADEADDKLPDTTDFKKDAHELRPAVLQPFKAGESLRFSVQYGFIHAGSAWLEVPEIVEWNGRPSYRLVARAESNGFFSKMYKVRNRIESLWDVDGRHSSRYLEDRHEGKFHANDTITFAGSPLQARYKNGQSFDLKGPVQDALSSFYYFRTQPLPVGGSITFDYHASRKTAPLEVKVLGRQRIKTPAGRFDCLVIEPILKAGGIFKNKGRLVIWLTDDERRMPVMMRSKVLIGSISVVLQEAKPGS